MSKSLMVVAAMLLIGTSAAVAGPLHDAIKDGDIEQVKLLIAQGENVNQRHRTSGSPLHHAAVWANGDIVELLLAEGADVSSQHPFLGTPLSIAAFKGNEAAVVALIANGADIAARSADGLTPLHAAASGGNTAVVELLVTSGADVNARSTIIELGGDFGPIQSAGLNGHFDIVALLRALGATGPTIKPVSDLLASADPREGEIVFGNHCEGCHLIEKGAAEPQLGPNLWGVLGRKKASVEEVSYSATFGRLVGIWTLAEFNAFIAAPMDYAPGTAMNFTSARVKDPVERANLIAFLRQNSDDPPPLPATVADK